MNGLSVCKRLRLQFHLTARTYDSARKRTEIKCLFAYSFDIGTDIEVFRIRQLECLSRHFFHFVVQNNGVNRRVYERERIDGFDIVADGYFVEMAFVIECQFADMRYGISLAGDGICNRIRNSQRAVLHIHASAQII